MYYAQRKIWNLPGKAYGFEIPKGSTSVLASLGFSVVVAGTVLACLAARHERLASKLELVAGVMVVTGLALIGTQIHPFH